MTSRGGHSAGGLGEEPVVVQPGEEVVQVGMVLGKRNGGGAEGGERGGERGYADRGFARISFIQFSLSFILQDMYHSTSHDSTIDGANCQNC